MCLCALPQILEDLVPVLEPLAEATEILTAESVPTAGTVFVLLKELHSDLEDMQDIEADENSDQEEDGDDIPTLESPVAKTLKTAIRTRLKERFKLDVDGQPSDEQLNSPLLAATFLDPRHKGLTFLHERKAVKVIQHVEELMDAVQNSESVDSDIRTTVKQEVPDVPVKKLKKLSDRIAGDIVDLTTPTRSNDLELRDYRMVAVREPNPLKWWQDHENQFPTLAKLALKYLAIPPTEVPSERLFSKAGSTINKVRASLESDTADYLLFINKNMPMPPMPPQPPTSPELPEAVEATTSESASDCQELLGTEAGPTPSTSSADTTMTKSIKKEPGTTATPPGPALPSLMSQ